MFGFHAQAPSFIVVAHGAALLAAASTLAVSASDPPRVGRLAVAAGLILACAVSTPTFIALGWTMLFGLGCAFSLRRAASVSFSGEEEAVRATILATVPADQARHILDQGFWLMLPAGDTILRPGRPPPYSIILGAGRVRLIDFDGRIEARGPGALLSPAHCRSAILDTPARLWCAPPHLLESMRPAEIGN